MHEQIALVPRWLWLYCTFECTAGCFLSYLTSVRNTCQYLVGPWLFHTEPVGSAWQKNCERYFLRINIRLDLKGILVTITDIFFFSVRKTYENPLKCYFGGTPWLCLTKNLKIIFQTVVTWRKYCLAREKTRFHEITVSGLPPSLLSCCTWQIRCARAAIIAAARPRRGFDKTASAEDLKGAELSEEERPSLRQPARPRVRSRHRSCPAAVRAGWCKGTAARRPLLVSTVINSSILLPETCAPSLISTLLQTITAPVLHFSVSRRL